MMYAASAPSATDPYFSNVVLLLHMDGSNGGTTFTDSSSYGHTMTVTGATTSTAQAKFGTAVGYFSGTNQYLTTPSSADFDVVPTGDFTVEFWVYPTTLTGATYQYIFSRGADSNNNFTVYLFDNGSAFSVAVLYVSGGSVYINSYPSTYDIARNAWSFVSICRVGNIINIFVGGVLKLSATCTAGGSALSSTINIGRRYDASSYFYGNIDDLRITKGIARYTNNFTVPSAAFPNAGNTPYATWNPSDKGANVTLSGGNLVAATTASTGTVRDTLGKTSGKYYWEVLVGTVGTQELGIANSSATLSNYLGQDANGWGYQNSGNKVTGASSVAYGASYTNADVIGCALDLDNATVSFYKNNAFQGIAYTGLSGTLYPALGSNSSTMSDTANFGQNPLTYTPPNGTFWNPKDADVGGGLTLSNNNMSWAVAAPPNYGLVRTNTGKSTGRYYFEITIGTTGIDLGVSLASLSTASTLTASGGFAMRCSSGSKYINGGGAVGYGSAVAAGHVVGVAVNLTDGKLYFSDNGTWENSGTPGGAETGYATNTLSGTYFPTISTVASPENATLNTGATPFAYTPPSGYSAWDATVYNAGVY